MRVDDAHGGQSALLDAWNGHDWSDGVQVEQLHELDMIAVHTRNSTYQLIVKNPASGDVLVRGGRHFPSFTPARVSGSSAGGSVVKRGGIYPGLRLELGADTHRILTSSVVSIELAPAHVDE